MERETLDFDRWLQTVRDETEELGLVDSLNELAILASERLRVCLWFVEIHGRRWSYIAGVMPEEPSASGAERVELGDNIGLVSDSWDRLPKSERAKLLEFLNQLVSQKQPARTKP